MNIHIVLRKSIEYSALGKLMLNYNRLPILIEVVRLGSFTAAGHRLGYTASAVSQHMSALEREVGAQLFERSGRSVRPTHAARTLAHRAARLIAGVDAAATAATHDFSINEFRIGTFSSAARFMLAPLLAPAAQQPLAERVTAVIGEPSQTLPGLHAGGELDAAIVYEFGHGGHTLPRGVTRHSIGDDPYLVVVPGNMGFHDGQLVSAHELRSLSWLIHTAGSGDTSVTTDALSAAGIHPRIAASSDDFTATLALVAAGLGAALIPRLAIRERPRNVCLLSVPTLELSRRIVILESVHAPAEPMARLVSGCRRLLAGLDASALPVDQLGSPESV